MTKAKKCVRCDDENPSFCEDCVAYLERSAKADREEELRVIVTMLLRVAEGNPAPPENFTKDALVLAKNELKRKESPDDHLPELT